MLKVKKNQGQSVKSARSKQLEREWRQTLPNLFMVKTFYKDKIYYKKRKELTWYELKKTVFIDIFFF